MWMPGALELGDDCEIGLHMDWIGIEPFLLVRMYHKMTMVAEVQ
jgi:hypothetical protein